VTRLGVRSDALLEVAAASARLADEVREEAAGLAASVSCARAPFAGGWRGRTAGATVAIGWVRVQAAVVGVVGPGGAWGEAVALDALAVDLRAAARVYAEVEGSVRAVLEGVRAGADLAARGGWLTDGVGSVPVVLAVTPTPGAGYGPGTGTAGVLGGVAGLVSAGEGLDGGRVRVLETTLPEGESGWVVVVPGTQEWSPRAGTNPFDVTTDVRAMLGDATVAAAGVALALERARAASGRSDPDDPVLLVGHSQGGILAAALASDPTFRARHHVTHVVTSGAPVGLFPVGADVRVLAVEHTDDPVPRLDLSPNPASSRWVTIRAPRGRAPVDVTSHRREAYVETVAAAEGAPHGTVPGLDAWQVSAWPFLAVPVRSVSEFQVRRR
jgi:hypothetical protein